MTGLAVVLVVVGLVLVLLGVELTRRPGQHGAARFAVLLGGAIALIAGLQVLLG